MGYTTFSDTPNCWKGWTTALKDTELRHFSACRASLNGPLSSEVLAPPSHRTLPKSEFYFQATEEHLMALILQKFYSIWIWNSGVVLLNINFILIVWHLITIIINLSHCLYCYPIIISLLSHYCLQFPWKQSRLAVFLVPGSCGHGPSTFPGGQQFLGTTVPKSQWIILR